MKWASLPNHLRQNIEEDEHKRGRRGGSSLQRKTSLQARTRLGVGKGTRQVRKALRRDVGIDCGAPKRFRATTFRDRAKLAKLGRRGRRLAAGDKRISEMFRAMDCICGCSYEPDPAHLRTRAHESTRHVEHLIIPLDRLAHEWMDHTAEGVHCREVLFEMAERKGEPLTHAEFWPVADAYGMYGWVAQRRAINKAEKRRR